MRVLLLRPPSPNERFGLGPFFRVEPLGLEYVGQALLAAGHSVRLLDLRFGSSLSRTLARFRPGIVAASVTHVIDAPTTLEALRQVKREHPDAVTVVGGHAASVYPQPLIDASVDWVVDGDGEGALVALARALDAGRRVEAVPGLRRRLGSELAPLERADSLQGFDESAGLPARGLVADYRKYYHCVHKLPLYAIETSRGCPFRCSFCSITAHSQRSFRARPLDAVVDDFASTGPNVFVVDDLFFHPRERSLELASELTRRGVKKDWLLVQCRPDLVARHAEALAAWRPLARTFDLFFGFEAASDAALGSLSKDLSVSETEQAVLGARELGYGVTGNFVVDPDWTEADFEAMWALVERLGLTRAGYTILTPLPGTPLFERLLPRIREHDLGRYDMSHLL
jgi:radical SAM superfamily enzyme YgiQ (UPF0313 family)